MKTINTITPKNKEHNILLFGLGTLTFGVIAFLAIKTITKNKSKNDTSDQENNSTDTIASHQNNPTRSATANISAIHNGESFPLGLGSKGNRVKQLQLALIASYSKAFLAKHSSDGIFGQELESALTKNGFRVPLSQSDFLKITEKQKEEEKTPFLIFKPNAIAFGLYNSLLARDFASAMTLMKMIKNVADYSSVSTQFKTYRINGIRQTLVNGLLNVFTERSQREIIKTVFTNMGLSYSNGKWSNKIN